MTIIVDAHEDLAWNMITFQRSYLRASVETRQLEQNTPTPEINGNTVLGWPDYQAGKVAIIFSTLFASPIRHKSGEWDILSYQDAAHARQAYTRQLDSYRQLVESNPDKFQFIQNKGDLDKILTPWLRDGAQDSPSSLPVGLVVLMEGAEAISTVSELEYWWDNGVRIIGPAWAGTRFCGGTREPGPLTKEGVELLAGMEKFGFTLDISHMDEQAALQALDRYDGPIIASHANPAAVVRNPDTNRHLSDRVIKGVIERDGVIGIVFYNFFLRHAWKKDSRQPPVTMHDVAAHVDYICTMAGNARHVGIGSDFDGGTTQIPADVHSIADVQNLSPILEAMGYSSPDIAQILGQNWIAHLRKHLPEK